MVILITGGGGFLGSEIARMCHQEGHKVRVLGRSDQPLMREQGMEVYQADLADADEEKLRQACQGVDAVIHTAAKAGIWGRWESYYRTNVLGTRRVIAACVTMRIPKRSLKKTHYPLMVKMAYRSWLYAPI